MVQVEGKMSTTWLFLVLLPAILTSLSSSSPTGKTENKSKTMYETLALKCPHLEETELHENFKDIFDNKCTNWTAINDTKTVFSNGITNAQCLVLYESLLSFCTNFGERLSRVKGFMPTNATLSKESVFQICNISRFLNNTEHNISDILNPINCALMCGQVLNQEVVVHDICRLSYFFGTFRVNDFLRDSNSLIAKNTSFNGSDPLNQKGPVSDVEKPIIIPNHSANKDLDTVQSPQEETIEKQELVGKDEHMQPNVEHSHVDLAAGAGPFISTGNQTSKKELETQAELSKSELQGKPGEQPKNQESRDANLNIVKEVDTKSNIDQSNIETPAKSKPEDAQKGQKAPETDQKPLGSPLEKGGVNPEEHNSGEQQDSGGNGDQYNEDKDEEIDEKGEEQEIIPNNESEPSTKIEKPTTVEKEAVSSYNIPDDDMDGDSYFFSYFTVLMCLVVVAYVGYHNRQKILALVLEGKRGKRSGRQGRRPNSANYHKLGSNLEEAISSSCKKDTSNIIY